MTRLPNTDTVRAMPNPVIRFIDEMFANQDRRIREAIARSAEHDRRAMEIWENVRDPE